MRCVIAATMAYLLVACAAPSPSQGSYSPNYQSQVQAYAKAGG